MDLAAEESYPGGSYPELQAILFDLDGTLLDSATGLLAAAELVLQEDGQAYERQQLEPIAAIGSVGLLARGYGLNRDDERITPLRQRFLRHYANLRQSDQLFAGSTSIINTLQSQQMPWGIVTNKPRALTKQVLQQFPLLQQAGSVISAEDAPEIKPAPDGLLMACMELDVSASACIYVGDFDIDYYAAKSAGMRVVLIDARRHYRRLGADWCVDSMQQAAELLQRLVLKA